jgi:polyisoprenoid-binding protein YceI
MKTKNLILAGLIPVLFSCGGAENSDETVDVEVQEKCIYSYDANSTILTFTAFKLTEKIGVDGTFNEINVVAKESEDMFGVLTGATFEIPVSSLNTQDEVRDGKLKNSFFGNLENSSLLTGTINSMDATTASVTINMNGMSVDYDGTITVDGESITMNTTIDILDFNGQVAVDSLGIVCAEKHTGGDGVNKFWTDVNIAVKTTLVKDCK